MAVVAMMELANATTEQYDQVVEKMNLHGKAAPNGIFHVCADDGAGGLRLVDVWESVEAFQEFGAKQMSPLMTEAGVTEPPKISVLPVHNFLERC